MSDWDAAKYHRISDPQLAWGRAVAARLAPADGERILDLGCGTGRLTEEIAQLPGIFVVGLDYSDAMLRQVRRQGPRTNGVLPVYVRGDGAALPFARAFDAVFSAAVFHWIPDHDQLFRSVYDALKPGGRLVAQCGGAGNLDRLYGRARTLMASPRYRDHFSGWRDFNHFEKQAELQLIGGQGLEVVRAVLIRGAVQGPAVVLNQHHVLALAHVLGALKHHVLE